MPEFTIQQAFDQALQHHQAGRLREAEQLYRQVLARQPEHAGALHNLGVIANRVGRNDMAVDLFRQALALVPNFPEAYTNLGNALRDMGQIDQAIAAYRQAIALRPNYAIAHGNLGNALSDKKQFDQAIAAHRQAIALSPNYAAAYSNLGNALRDNGQLDEAVAAFRQAIALNPKFPEAYSNLGNALGDQGQLEEAIAAQRQALALRPNFPEACNNLASALKNNGQLDEAIAACRQAIALRPNYAAAHNSLGNSLRDKGLLDEAIAACRQAIALRPNYAEAHCNLGNALKDKEQTDDAIAAYRQAIALKPDLAEACNNLGSALKDQGQLDQAIAAYRQAVALKPSYAGAYSNLVYALHFHPQYTGLQILQTARAWARQYEGPLAKEIPAHANDPTPDRRLRIGYVSPNFSGHVVGLNMLPLLSAHDHAQFEIHCFSSVLRPDATTARFEALADRWHKVGNLSDAALASYIRAQKIDILMDWALHMSNNRLLTFAAKPAPVQVTFAGYPGTTGLQAIDYRLSDPYLDPPGSDDALYSETTLRLPHTFWCYDPSSAQPEVNELPALANGYVTFGCLNNFCKVQEPAIRLWARVLAQVSASRLLLLGPEGEHRAALQAEFAAMGIAPQRIEFVALQPRSQYLRTYHRIDLGLDTLPYNGHTTSLDAMWMGVPVITRVGATVVGRAGFSQLSNLGLTELVAWNDDDFLRIAVDWANHPARLAELRGTLRSRMQQSPLMDVPNFARNIEATYRQMWHTWCQTISP